MLYRNNGIIARGLGGGPSSVILGNWSVGSSSVEVIVTPGGGSGGSAGRYNIPPTSPRRRRRDPEIVYDLITVRVTHKGKTWEDSYSVKRKMTPIIVRLGAVLNTVVTKLSVVTKNMRKIANKIRIGKYE